MDISFLPRFGVFRFSSATGSKPNPTQLERVLGDGPPTLRFEKAREGLPGYYTDPEKSGTKIFSFSTIKQTVKPVLDPNSEEILKSWVERVGEKEAEEIRREAIVAGQTIHKMFSRWVEGQSLGPCSLAQTPFRQALECFILPELKRKIPPVGIWAENGDYLVLNELTLVDFNRGYLGRFDLVVEFANNPFARKRVLLELKGSRNQKSLEFLGDPIVQAVSYLEILDKIAAAYPENCNFSPLDGVAIACAYGSGKGEIFPILGEDIFEYSEQWNLWLNTFQSILDAPIAS